eukprot:4145971-Prymnesium_polylepis.2
MGCHIRDGLPYQGRLAVLEDVERELLGARRRRPCLGRLTVLEDVERELLGARPPRRLVGRRVDYVADAVARLRAEDELIGRQLVRRLQLVSVEPAVPVHAHAGK